ncbi:MAG TPA: tRNA 2-thiouridine(34) synthase MnmA [Clostridiales bacterium]|nr:tRNA 2-thiouridine(34) synthase MnmA [Clostridiales bacterium]
MKKVLMAMSGGVDSSVAAAELLKQGFEVTGVTLKLHDGEISDEMTRTCCSLADVTDARSVCDKLGIRHYVFNFKQRFADTVIQRFIDQYRCGGTPNPCIDCNRFIKFDELLKRAQLLGHDYVATGHYCIREYDKASNRYLLKKAVDRNKDQTYVLYSLTQQQLEHILFPLGGLLKEQVREIAAEMGFINSNKPDSQDICFVTNGKYADFIEEHTGQKAQKGDFVDTKGRKIGEHKGYIRYTIGQRKGLGVAFGKPMFVVDIIPETNTVVLGEEADLYSSRLIAEDVNFIPFDKLTSPLKVTAKVRYSQREEAATIHPMEDGKVLAEFERPLRAITPGQAVVFYDGEYVVGGGTIEKNIKMG